MRDLDRFVAASELQTSLDVERIETALLRVQQLLRAKGGLLRVQHPDMPLPERDRFWEIPLNALHRDGYLPTHPRLRIFMRATELFQLFGPRWRSMGRVAQAWLNVQPARWHDMEWCRQIFEAYCAGGWLMYWSKGGTLVWVARPEWMESDQGGNFHCETGPALVCALGERWYWHGVNVPRPRRS